MSWLSRKLGKRKYQGLLLGLLLVSLFYQSETGILPQWSVATQTTIDATSAPTTVRAIRVVDGDTFEIEGGERVRLIGVDTPETVKPNALVECFGKEASAYLSQLIEGKSVRLEKDTTDRDRYARLLRYVYLDDVFVNEEIVRAGYAEAVAYRPDTALQPKLEAAEHLARQEARGRWAACP